MLSTAELSSCLSESSSESKPWATEYLFQGGTRRTVHGALYTAQYLGLMQLYREIHKSKSLVVYEVNAWFKGLLSGLIFWCRVNHVSSIFLAMMKCSLFWVEISMKHKLNCQSISPQISKHVSSIFLAINEVMNLKCSLVLVEISIMHKLNFQSVSPQNSECWVLKGRILKTGNLLATTIQPDKNSVTRGGRKNRI